MDIDEIKKRALMTLEKSPLKSKVHRLSLFGSHLHGEATEGSDVDLLVEFKADATVGYFKLARMQIDLSEGLGTDVDLLTPGALHRNFKDKVLKEAVPLYEDGEG